MKLLIDIDNESYEHIMKYANEKVFPMGWYSIINGKPLKESCEDAISRQAVKDWSGESPFCPRCGARMESEDKE